MAAPLTLNIGEDTVLEVNELKDEISEEFINDATLTMAVLDSSGDPVEDASALPLSYVTGSDGNYRGTVPGTLTLSATCKYTIWFTGETGDGLPISRPREAVARYA